MLFRSGQVSRKMKRLENGKKQRISSTSSSSFGNAETWAVRRLTPRECERLQGFPDDWTAVPWRGKAVPADGPRYKACGNSMAVNVMRWLGERIDQVDRIMSRGTRT